MIRSFLALAVGLAILAYVVTVPLRHAVDILTPILTTR